ncbi:hypothetical protein MAJHIDBO_00253 [Propionibacterium freudenreichii subsp. shermanii]|nr:hypothetical protein MAJHIDBO_00253 [Propionibacterium freudenreichii subsp. shermanii]SPS08042.1 hypothetical protein MAJHIDBO_00253 [Propionibacterium freudenreichii subsp. shermanii]
MSTSGSCEPMRVNASGPSTGETITMPAARNSRKRCSTVVSRERSSAEVATSGSSPNPSASCCRLSTTLSKNGLRRSGSTTPTTGERFDANDAAPRLRV